MMRAVPRILIIIGCWLMLAVSVSAGSIDTGFIEESWPREWVRNLEVGKYPVRWRHFATREDGVFVGMEVTALSDRQTTWRLATDYTDIGRMTPDVTDVRIIEETPTRQVIQIDIKILWKSLQLTFEVEQEPFDAVRFRLTNDEIGEYRGILRLTDPAISSDSVQTQVKLATWFSPVRSVPLRLLVTVQRMVLLHGIKEFLIACEQTYEAANQPE